MRLITGTKKAAVFPEPVCAHDIKSRQLFKVGIEYFYKYNSKIQKKTKIFKKHFTKIKTNAYNVNISQKIFYKI